MMKRLASCESLDMGGSDGGFQAMLSGEEVGKKRRLSAEQVKALEKNFEVENKLEPDRKMKLAEEVGLQPRQVAVWFQNRRARWKTKQLEREYAVLQATHDALKLKFQALRRDNQSLTNQIEELRSKLKDNGTTDAIDVKNEPSISEGKFELISPSPSPMDTSLLDKCVEHFGNTATRDGSSDSDSSAILNEDNNNIVKLLNAHNEDVHIRVSEENGSSSQMIKIEEHDFFTEEESCTTFFSDDQPPCLNWYCSDSWN